MENKFRAGFISVIWIISISMVVYCSLVPRVELPVDFWQADKLYHFISYGWLSVLPMIGYSGRKFALTSSFTMILLGVLIEMAQWYVPGRTFSVADIIANTLGVFLGIYSGSSLKHFKPFA